MSPRVLQGSAGPTRRPASAFRAENHFRGLRRNSRTDLADELEGVSADDRAKLKVAINEVAAGGPRAEVGAARIKRMLGTASTGVGKALWKITVEVASEAAKKILLGN